MYFLCRIAGSSDNLQSEGLPSASSGFCKNLSGTSGKLCACDQRLALSYIFLSARVNENHQPPVFGEVVAIAADNRVEEN